MRYATCRGHWHVRVLCNSSPKTIEVFGTEYLRDPREEDYRKKLLLISNVVSLDVLAAGTAKTGNGRNVLLNEQNRLAGKGRSRHLFWKQLPTASSGSGLITLASRESQWHQYLRFLACSDWTLLLWFKYNINGNTYWFILWSTALIRRIQYL